VDSLLDIAAEAFREVATLSGVRTILFDSIVVAVTVQNIFDISWFQRSSEAKQSFPNLLIRQGVPCDFSWINLSRLLTEKRPC
jgi:hypothetical protein